jgi:type IV secretory pathway VirB4 component
VTAGEQSMFESSLHLIIRASSREELEQKTRRVASRATTTFTRRPRTAHFEQAEAFRACLPGQMNGRHPHLLPSSVISSMIPFFDHFIFRPSATAILEGLTQHNEPVILDWWADLTNANRLILGASGWGKSYKAKLDILHLYYMYKQLAQRRGGSGQPQQHQQQEGDGFQILIVDPERETDRAPGFSLIERLGGQSIRFSPGSRHHLNPLDLPPVTKNAADTEMDAKEDVLANHIQRLHRIFDLMLAHNVEDKASSLTPQEKSLLDATLYEAYRRAGISPDRTTHQRPAPLLRDVQRILAGEVCGPDPTGLAQRLRRYTDGSLSGLFSDQTNIDLHNTVIQFDVKELAEGELRPITLMMISNLIWNIAFASRIPRFLFIDEMATVGRYRSGQYFLEEIFQRARKHYLSVVGMTQEPGHLSKAIIANCASHVLLHQDDTTLDTITDLFKLSSREAMRLRGFDRGEALLLAGGKRMMVRFVASPLEDRLITTNRRQIAAIEATAATRNNQP